MKRLALVGVFIFLGSALWSAITNAPQGTVLQLDPLFAMDQQDELAASYATQLRNKDFLAAHAVEQCKVQRTPCGNQIACRADTPCTIINDTHALTRSGQLVPQTLFKEIIIGALPHMTLKDITQFEANHSGIVALAQKLTFEITTRYAISWIRPSTVTWSDRECPGLTLVTRADQFVSPEQSQVAQKIYMKLGDSQPTRERDGLIPSNFVTMGKTGQKMMVVDLRFDRHHIVKIGSGGSNGSFIG